LLQEGRFIVPSHQRDFAWNDDCVKQLFDDVVDALNKKSDSYFLGLLVFLYSGNAYTILDGQQRLATTVIIFAAIRDGCGNTLNFIRTRRKYKIGTLVEASLARVSQLQRLFSTKRTISTSWTLL
jgi:uncharacterized protein with ParB-like and HNH nuclease domain